MGRAGRWPFLARGRRAKPGLYTGGTPLKRAGAVHQQDWPPVPRGYADSHVKFSHYSGRHSPGEDNPCLENWWADHHWEGYFE